MEEQFPELNNKERILCAYIKMNLMSKEIAPLLNISVRGVEISRYRLRKKLNLGEKESLVDFLQKLSL
ncbi:MAG: LuxR C-terminal-related transcriptional regulator [Bacteroides graminisolvens]